MSAPKDISGQRFGKLVVVARAANTGEGRAAWNCRCDCGGECRVTGKRLRTNHTRSCGCESSRKTFGERTLCYTVTHGLTKTRNGITTKPHGYRSWEGAKDRCTNPNNRHFHRYGGRGIYMCAEWLSGYGAFHSDMGLKPAGLTLHRIDNDGPYAPWNCKWADAKEQASNKYYPKHKPRHRVTVAGLLFGR